MTKYFSPFILLMFLAACNNSDAVSENREDTSEVEEPYVNPYQQQIQTAFPETYQFFSEQDSSFSALKFEDMGEDTIKHQALPLRKEKLEAYYPLFIYSQDSSYAIDLYSYNVLLGQRGNPNLVHNGGPDTEVGLINLKEDTRKRIYFGGSSSSVLDARWINRHEFFLLTGETMGDNRFQPAILKYDVSNNVMSHFVYRDTLNVQASDYRDRRLEPVLRTSLAF
jgi:hypothetical protein